METTLNRMEGQSKIYWFSQTLLLRDTTVGKFRVGTQSCETFVYVLIIYLFVLMRHYYHIYTLFSSLESL